MSDGMINTTTISWVSSMPRLKPMSSVTNDPPGLRSSAEQSGEGEAVHESEAGGDTDLAASGRAAGWHVCRDQDRQRDHALDHTAESTDETEGG
jgi:hypothetical protein